MLTEKQQAFCEEYLIDLNGTQAAIRAGYAVSGAAVEGARLLRNANVRARIENLIDARSKRTLIHADFVIDGLVENVNRCQQAHPVMEFDPVEKCMVQKRDGEGNGVWEFDSQGANKALELLGRHLGLFLDKSKVEHGVQEILVRYANRSNTTAPPPGTGTGTK